MEAVSPRVTGRVLAGKDEERLLTSFFVLYKTARLVEPGNTTFKNQASTFCRLLEQQMAVDGELTLKTISGRYFVNERMVRFDDQGLSGAAGVIEEWDSLGIGGVAFDTTVTRPELEKFFTFMAGVKPNSDNIEILSERLKSLRLENVRLLSRASVVENNQAAAEEARRAFRAIAQQTFFKAMNVVQEVIVSTSNDKEINVSKTKRVIHSLIDHILRDESSLIELTAIKSFDDYTYAHCTNVCVYSLTMGVRLGLDRARLSQLGFSALFHDVGKAKLPRDLIHKPDAFDENDWIQMQQHPLLGAKTILRNLKFDEHSARAARGAFEHHINKDFTGYPTLRLGRRKVNLFSKIISIVDTFDALTSGRVYLKQAIEPEDVLKKMQYQMKVKFDEFLLKIFNDIVGIYPAGSLVLLTTDEIALVLSNNQVDKARPFVKVVGNRESLLENPIWSDLSLEENSHRKIVRKLDPNRYGLDVKDFILRD